MREKSAVEILLGPPEESGETWSKWTVSNGVARFRVCRHSSGEVHVLLISGRDLLISKHSDGEPFFNLMRSLGVIKDAECLDAFDCSASDHADCCPKSQEQTIRDRIRQNRNPQ